MYHSVVATLNAGGSSLLLVQDALACLESVGLDRPHHVEAFAQENVRKQDGGVKPVRHDQALSWKVVQHGIYVVDHSVGALVQNRHGPLSALLCRSPLCLRQITTETSIVNTEIYIFSFG